MITDEHVKNIKEPQNCCSREMTVVERLEYRRSSLIQELGRIEKAIEELKYRDISNETMRALIQLGN